jgi:glc operon protein GlcG
MKRIAGPFLALALAALAAPGAAWGAHSDQKILTLAAAKQIVAIAVAEARQDGSGGAIAVTDEGGALLYLERLDDTFPAASAVSIGKARTAATFRRPTKVFEDAIKNGRVALAAVDVMTPLVGGVPFVVDGQTIGAIGVSGAMSAARDEEIALAGAAAASAVVLQAVDAKVAAFDAKKVEASFAKGGVLLNNGHYMVHTSRRDAPGQAEVHALDTDIIYVLQGAATFVTGGTVIDGKETAPNEIRGATVRGGDTRQLKKGEVVVVPSGTPHWVKAVSGPVLYYTVEVQ